MKPALAFRQLHYPASWQVLPNGEIIKKAIEDQLAPWWPKFFGYHLAKLGALSAEIDIPNSTINNQVTIGSESDLINIVGDIDDLPLQAHSIDVCLLSHALEFSLDPHHVIREANRVIIPNGYLILTGYNPFSLVGLNSLQPYRKNKTPWNEHFFSPMRIKDWLHLMGFDILSDQRCLHSGLTGQVTADSLNNQWHRFAKKYVPSLGSIYVIVAKKRVLPLTPIKPRWKIRPEFNAVEVTTMHSTRTVNNANESGIK